MADKEYFITLMKTSLEEYFKAKSKPSTNLNLSGFTDAAIAKIKHDYYAKKKKKQTDKSKKNEDKAKMDKAKMEIGNALLPELSEKEEQILRWMEPSEKFIPELCKSLLGVFEHLIKWISSKEAGIKKFVEQLMNGLKAIMEKDEPPQNNIILDLIQKTILYIRENNVFDTDIEVNDQDFIVSGLEFSIEVGNYNKVSFREMLGFSRLITPKKVIWERRGLIDGKPLRVFDYPPIVWNSPQQLGYNEEKQEKGQSDFSSNLELVCDYIPRDNTGLKGKELTKKFQLFGSLWKKSSILARQKFVTNIAGWLGKKRNLWLKNLSTELQKIFKFTLEWLSLGKDNAKDKATFGNAMVDLLIHEMALTPADQGMKEEQRSYKLIFNALVWAQKNKEKLLAVKIQVDISEVYRWTHSMVKGVTRCYSLETNVSQVTFGSILNDSPVIDLTTGQMKRRTGETSSHPPLVFSAKQAQELKYEMDHKLEFTREYTTTDSITYVDKDLAMKIKQCWCNVVLPIGDVVVGIGETFSCNQQDNLKWAARKGEDAEVVKLIDKDININGRGTRRSWSGVVRGNIDQTPVMLAAEYGKQKVVERLVEAKADLTVVSCYGYTALDYALKAKQKETAQFLHQIGAKRKHKDYKHKSDEQITDLIKTFTLN